MRRAMLAAAAAATVSAAAAVPAQAHVQVRPANVAPDDPVLWTVLVPSEAASGTRRVELAVPTGVIPFSFEDTPGWKRTIEHRANGSVRSIVWRGRTAPDGLATFRFLASTPEREGTIVWKALQTYGDGKVVRWIGTRDSEFPAATVAVSAGAPRENAGGEGATAAVAVSQEQPGAKDGDGVDGLARVLAVAGVLVGLAGVALAARRRARGR